MTYLCVFPIWFARCRIQKLNKRHFNNDLVITRQQQAATSGNLDLKIKVHLGRNTQQQLFNYIYSYITTLKHANWACRPSFYSIYNDIKTIYCMNMAIIMICSLLLHFICVKTNSTSLYEERGAMGKDYCRKCAWKVPFYYVFTWMFQDRMRGASFNPSFPMEYKIQ